MTCRYLVADVFDGLASLEPNSVDLVVTSPPFLALRSYLPADHPDKARELGSEATPGAFIDRLLDVVEACDRVLAPHGSLVFELGDTYAGSGGAGGDYNDGGLRDGAPGFDGSAAAGRLDGRDASYGTGSALRPARVGRTNGWPLDKSKVLIPQLFAIALAYGFNPLTGRQTAPWRVRNTVAWCRPNPPVGRDGDKFRPATSFLTIATKARDRYWDGDAVRTALKYDGTGGFRDPDVQIDEHSGRHSLKPYDPSMSAGAPLLDYWVIPTSPYRGVWQGDTFYRASRDCPAHSLRAIRETIRTAPHGALQEAWLRNSRRTDLDPASRSDCERFASSDLGSPDLIRSMLDWIDRSIRSERTTESTLASRTPVPTNGGSPSVDARTVERTSRTPVRSTSPDQSWEPLNLEYAPTATPRSKASSRTALVPETSPSGTPSAETPGGTEHTSTSPESDVASDLGTLESRTDEGAPGDPSPRSEPHTIRMKSRCSCEQFTESGSHYVTYPPDLVVPLVKSMCPSRVCLVCGKPSTRIVGEAEYDYIRSDLGRVPATLAKSGGSEIVAGINQHKKDGKANSSVARNAPTLGWSDCSHNDWRPGLVLDPFAGSGTTLSVASGHGFDSVGIDLDERNAWLARERVGMLLEIEILGVSA